MCRPTEPSLFIAVEVRPSAIFGKGLFPLADVKRGTVVCSFIIDAKLITEEAYLDAVQAGQYHVIRTGTRYIGRYFTFTHEPEADLNFFNHSFTPNLLCHCGTVIALRDVPAGEELTIDYRCLIDDSDIGIYSDATTGQPIRGFSARETLLRTARQLIELLESLDESWVG